MQVFWQCSTGCEKLLNNSKSTMVNLHLKCVFLCFCCTDSWHGFRYHMHNIRPYIHFSVFHLSISTRPLPINHPVPQTPIPPHPRCVAAQFRLDGLARARLASARYNPGIRGGPT